MQKFFSIKLEFHFLYLHPFNIEPAIYVLLCYITYNKPWCVHIRYHSIHNIEITPFIIWNHSIHIRTLHSYEINKFYIHSYDKSTPFSNHMMMSSPFIWWVHPNLHSHDITPFSTHMRDQPIHITPLYSPFNMRSLHSPFFIWDHFIYMRTPQI